ncbi:alpha/beta hydrolase [Paenibacillus ginsengarvi]|uniref:Alpha/beta hydrolase n=1 Tax=Paenibacillus ginsengarvi TaxID=400777 RepID=A0A3B0C7S6_9BACL|nr:alpha/beta hydrolase [Paenibacillus ginsengarvi]RKN80671.1 alpha/beta hydrolase [Paenibacillus ginsengarvi]
MEQLLNVTYSEHYTEQRKMDIFVPGDNANGVGLLFIHGGGWNAGNRMAWHSVAAHFCELGYSCASVGYRLAPEWHHPAQIEDVRLGMSFFMENAAAYRFDPTRTAALGSSAGGHLAAMLSTIAAEDELGISPELRIRNTRPGAAVLYCPATNLHLDDNFDSLNGSIVKLFGSGEAELPGAYSEASPVDRIVGEEPVTLLIHGDDDKVIPVEHSRVYYEKLAKHGIRAELLILPGVPHGFGYGVKTPAQLESLAAIERFLRDVYPA